MNPKTLKHEYIEARYKHHHFGGDETHMIQRRFFSFAMWRQKCWQQNIGSTKQKKKRTSQTTKENDPVQAQIQSPMIQ